MSRSRYRPRRYIGGAGPRLWRNTHTNRPLRREWQRIARNAVRGAELDDIALTPTNRLRPYYW